MRTFAVVACLLLASGVAVRAQSPAQQPAHPPAATAQQPAPPATAATTPKIDPAKEADIRRLLKMTGTKELAMQAMARMEATMRPMMTNALPPGDYRAKLIDLFFAKFNSKLDPQVFVDMAIPVYDKYFTEDEIKGLIQFDQTPLGHKLLSSLPKLEADIQEKGGAWGQKMGRECMLEVLAENPDLEKALEDATRAQQQPPQ